MKIRNRLIIPLALLALALSARAQAQVLDQVPSDAIAVLKVKNLNAINAKIIKIAHAWGIDEMVPEFKDPLGSMLEKGHMSQGINKDGDAAIAFFPMPAGQPAGAPPKIVGIIPVSDYKAFVGNFKEPQEDGDITSATSTDDNKPVFIAHWGDFAAVADNKETLANKPAGFKLAGLAAKEAESKDITIFANMEQLRTVGLPKLKEQREKFLNEMQNNLGKDEASKKLAPVVKAVVNMYMNAVQDYIEQGTSGVISIDLSDAGISAGSMAEFQPDSRLGQNFAQLKGTGADSALAGLPDKKYFAVGGYAADPKVAQQMLGNLADPIVKELGEAGDQWKPVGDMVSSMKDAVGAMNASGAGYIVPSGAAGQEAVLQSVAVSKGDSKVIRDSNRKVFQSLADMLKSGPQSTNAPMTFDFKPDAKTVDGVSFDQLQTNLAMDPNDPKAAQAQQAIALLYGPNGVGAYAGAADDSHYIVVTGGNDQLISDAIASAKGGQDAISPRPNVAMVASHLAKKPVLVYYVFLDNIATSASKLAENFGFPIKLHLPDDLPPIGISVATDGPSIRFDTFVPTELIQNLISAGLKARQDMAGGNNNGPQ